MRNNKIGSAEIISYRTGRQDQAYKYPLEGVFTGTSVSHVALRLTFEDQELFNKYIANNPRIPSNNNLINPITGTKLYEVYLSFWPDSGLDLQSTDSKLVDYRYDCEQSALGSPMTYTSRMQRYFKPDRASIAPMIPILRDLIKSSVTLPPSIMLHTSRLENMLKHAYRFQDPDRAACKITEIIKSAKRYCKSYEAWCDAHLAEHNLNTDDRATNYSVTTTTMEANAELESCRERLKNQLKQAIFSGQEISDQDFIRKIEEVITFGRPEIDIVALPLVASGDSGLRLEPMLEYIKSIAENPATYKYNLFNMNCATVLHQALRLGARDSTNRKLVYALTLPWYVRLFNAPVSPAMIIQAADAAQQIIGTITLSSRVPVPEQSAAAANTSVKLNSQDIIQPILAYHPKLAAIVESTRELDISQRSLRR